MKNLTIAMILFVLPFMVAAQEDEPKYNMVELVELHVKSGMNDQFEKAVLAHNENYHSGPHAGRLYSVATGSNAGAYIWRMGPCTMTDLDSRPDSDEHNDDWDNNVSKYIESVGSVEYWSQDADLSYMGEDGDVSMVTIWTIDLAKGEWNEFEEFMEKVKKVYSNIGKEGIYVWWNRFGENNGRDVAVTWAMEGWSDFDDQSWSMDEEYEKEFGEGEWEEALDDWEDFTEGIIRTVWYIVD